MDHLLLQAQVWWDAQRFDQPVWPVAAWRDHNVRPMHLHVTKALGKVVAAWGEAARTTPGTDLMARVRDEVLPDVAISRSQLLNLFPEVCPPSSLAYHSASAGVQEGESLLKSRDSPPCSSCQSGEKRGASSRPTRDHLCQLQPTTNC